MLSFLKYLSKVPEDREGVSKEKVNSGIGLNMFKDVVVVDKGGFGGIPLGEETKGVVIDDVIERRSSGQKDDQHHEFN